MPIKAIKGSEPFYFQKHSQTPKRRLCSKTEKDKTNHVHLLTTPHKKDGISKTMRIVGASIKSAPVYLRHNPPEFL
ncbi:MAG: hypothetical protein D3924_19990, partial [Candidatus Electrothrix sp. AR4]|nr:hypothetical protein [Candidatus Electrothrix sp. AR4]